MCLCKQGLDTFFLHTLMYDHSMENNGSYIIIYINTYKEKEESAFTGACMHVIIILSITCHT